MVVVLYDSGNGDGSVTTVAAVLRQSGGGGLRFRILGNLGFSHFKKHSLPMGIQHCHGLGEMGIKLTHFSFLGMQLIQEFFFSTMHQT